MFYRLLFIGILSLSACSGNAKSTPVPPIPPPEVAQQGTNIREVQQQLADAGYYKGVVDGVWGPQSDKAVRSFQHDNGLPVTGAVDSALLMVLDTKDPAHYSHGVLVPKQ